MNTYNENLQKTVINTLAALSTQQTKLESKLTAAQYSLYYAQGAEITARDKLADTNVIVDFCQRVNDQSLINDNQAANLLATVTTANTYVSTGNTNMATAASNVQIASNAIAMLASDIGAALNIATASLFNTDSYKKILDANNFINEVANDSKSVSMHAMDTSSKTAEITATALQAQTNVVNTKIDNLLAATQTELNKFSDLSISENKVVSQTTKSEQLAEGALLDADKEASAIVRAYANANDRLNLGLTVSVNSGTQISVVFSALPDPLPTFRAQPASDIAIPKAKPEYYLTLVPSDKMAMFSTDQAEQLFASRTLKNGIQFYPITPSLLGASVVLVNDVFNNPIQAGSSYVAFLYIALSMDYKRFIGNFMDLLSAPSQAFIPATTLPLAESSVSNAMGAAFDLLKAMGQAAGVDTLSVYNDAVGNSAEQPGASKVIADEDALTKAQAALLAVAPATDSWYPDACKVVIDTLLAAYFATVADAQGTSKADAQQAAVQSVASATAAVETAGRVKAADFNQGVDSARIIAAAGSASKAAETVADAAASVVNEALALDVSATGILSFAVESNVSAAAGQAWDASIDLIKTIGQAAGVDTLSVYNDAIGTSTEQARANTVIADEDAVTKVQTALLAVAPSSGSWYPDACEVVIETLRAAYYATVADAQGTAEADAQKAVGQSEASAKAASLAAERVVAADFPAGVDPAAISAAVCTASKAAATVADAAAAAIFAGFEFRCILVESGKQPDLNLLLSPDTNTSNPKPPIYFNLDIALQIAPANYVLAKPAEQTVNVAKKGKAGTTTKPNQQQRIYVVIFDQTTTDNFGNMIQSDKTYRPYILTTVNGSNRNQYLSVLSSALDPLNVSNKDVQVSK